METRRSPLLKYVMTYLREVVKDYRVEMEDIMACDRQLAQEIEFDLRQFQQKQKAAATTSGTTAPSDNQQQASTSGIGEFKAPFPKV